MYFERLCEYFIIPPNHLHSVICLIVVALPFKVQFDFPLVFLFI